MLFNSLQFIFFFPIVVAAYFAMKPKYRWILLLLASYYFYMCWNYKYIVLIIFSTVIDYFAGILLYKTSKQKLRILVLMASLTTNLGLLFFFKYFNFFGESINFLLQKVNIFYNIPAYHFLLPVGISFYTFQTLSYTIDIYKGKLETRISFRPVCPICFILSSACSRTYRTSNKPSAPVPGGLYLRVRTGEKWSPAYGLGFFQEGSHCRPAGRVC